MWRNRPAILKIFLLDFLYYVCHIIGMNDFIADMEQSIAKHEKEMNSQPRKGMMVYLDKNTPILVQYANEDSFKQAKSVSSRKGQQSCLRNVLDKGGRIS